MDVIVCIGYPILIKFMEKYTLIKNQFFDLFVLQVQRTLQILRLMIKNPKLFIDSEFEYENLIAISLLAFHMAYQQ